MLPYWRVDPARFVKCTKGHGQNCRQIPSYGNGLKGFPMGCRSMGHRQRSWLSFRYPDTGVGSRRLIRSFSEGLKTVRRCWPDRWFWLAKETNNIESCQCWCHYRSWRLIEGSDYQDAGSLTCRLPCLTDPKRDPAVDILEHSAWDGQINKGAF